MRSSVVCESGKELCLATTTSKHCEVFHVTIAGRLSCKTWTWTPATMTFKHSQVYQVTTAGKPVVTTSCKIATCTPATTMLGASCSEGKCTISVSYQRPMHMILEVHQLAMHQE